MPPRHSLAEELGLGLDGKTLVEGDYDDIDLRIQGMSITEISYVINLLILFSQKLPHNSSTRLERLMPPRPSRTMILHVGRMALATILMTNLALAHLPDDAKPPTTTLYTDQAAG